MKAKTALKVVNKRQMLYVLEDGTSDLRPTTTYLDPTGAVAFVIPLPDHVSGALGKPKEIRKLTADDAKREYEATLREYVQHMKTAKAEPIICVQYGYYAREDGRLIKANEPSFFHDDFDENRLISLSYTLAFRINGHVHVRVEKDGAKLPHSDEFGHPNWMKREPSTWVPGHRLSYPKGTVMPYTPELEATILALQNAIDRAAVVLKTLNQAKDPVAALLSVKNGLLLTSEA